MKSDIAGLREVSLREIKLTDFTYSVWAWSDYGRVQNAIAQAGMVEPPLLIERPGGFAIVSGHKRIRAAIDLGWDKVTCILMEQPREICQLFVNIVIGNLSFRDYNIIEKSLILNRLQALPPCGYSIEKIAAALGVSQPNIVNFNELANLPQESSRAVACGKVRPGAALEFTKLRTKGQLEFIKALEIVDLGENKQKEVIRLLLDLAKIEKCAPEDILQSNEVVQILQNNILNAPQKGARLREFLHGKRSPVLAQMETEFERAKARLAIPRNVRILNASPFEADSLTFSVSIGSGKDLEMTRRFLDKLGGDRNLDSLLAAAVGLPTKTPP